MRDRDVILVLPDSRILLRPGVTVQETLTLLSLFEGAERLNNNRYKSDEPERSLGLMERPTIILVPVEKVERMEPPVTITAAPSLDEQQPPAATLAESLPAPRGRAAFAELPDLGGQVEPMELPEAPTGGPDVELPDIPV